MKYGNMIEKINERMKLQGKDCIFEKINCQSDINKFKYHENDGNRTERLHEENLERKRQIYATQKEEYDRAMVEYQNKKFEFDNQQHSYARRVSGDNIQEPTVPVKPIEPTLEKIENMSNQEKLDDRSNGKFFIENKEGDFGIVQNGIIEFGAEIGEGDAVELHFATDADFTKIENWKEKLIEEFEDFMNHKPKEEFSMPDDLILEIVEPQIESKYLIDISSDQMNDNGNQWEIRNRIEEKIDNDNSVLEAKQKELTDKVRNLKEELVNNFDTNEYKKVVDMMEELQIIVNEHGYNELDLDDIEINVENKEEERDKVRYREIIENVNKFNENERKIKDKFNEMIATSTKLVEISNSFIDKTKIKNAYRAYLPGVNSPYYMMKWMNWIKNCEFKSLNSEEKEKERIKFKNKYMYSQRVIVTFKGNVILPKKWKLIKEHNIKCISKSKTQIQERIIDLNQCRYCADIYCENGRCREFNHKVKTVMQERNISFQSAKGLVRPFCKICGETCGHFGKRCPLEEKNQIKCKHCKSHKHGTRKNDACPYWVTMAILTLLLNDYYVKNKKVGRKYICDHGNLDPVWVPKNIDIDLNIIQSQFKLEHYNNNIAPLSSLLYLLIKNNNTFGHDINKCDIAYELHGLDLYNQIDQDIYPDEWEMEIVDKGNESKEQQQQEQQEKINGKKDEKEQKNQQQQDQWSTPRKISHRKINYYRPNYGSFINNSKTMKEGKNVLSKEAIQNRKKKHKIKLKNLKNRCKLTNKEMIGTMRKAMNRKKKFQERKQKNKEYEKKKTESAFQEFKNWNKNNNNNINNINQNGGYGPNRNGLNNRNSAMSRYSPYNTSPRGGYGRGRNRGRGRRGRHRAGPGQGFKGFSIREMDMAYMGPQWEDHERRWDQRQRQQQQQQQQYKKLGRYPKCENGWELEFYSK